MGKAEGRLLRGGDILALGVTAIWQMGHKRKALLGDITGTKAQRYEIGLKVVVLQKARLQAHLLRKHVF